MMHPRHKIARSFEIASISYYTASAVQDTFIIVLEKNTLKSRELGEA